MFIIETYKHVLVPPCLKNLKTFFFLQDTEWMSKVFSRYCRKYIYTGYVQCRLTLTFMTSKSVLFFKANMNSKKYFIAILVMIAPQLLLG